jgi:hypothetical protein
MPREKVERPFEQRAVVYSKERWILLRELRAEALKIMMALRRYGLHSIVHGSVARGDVSRQSDVDVFIPYPVPSYQVELALESSGYKVSHKLVVQATPQSTPKVYIVLDPLERRVVSYPLAKLTRTEYEFYYFGGALDYAGLNEGKRVAGVDKRLMLIEPTEEGHVETSVIGREAVVAKKLGISLDTVLERVRVLRRRDEVGRTGTFVKVVMEPWESVEDVVRRLANSNMPFRKVLRQRGSLIV